MESNYRPEVPKARSLSEFTRDVARTISREQSLMQACITAEISDMSVSGGHCYMTLIEKDASGTTIARMRATIWASIFQTIRRQFLNATSRELANGMKVMLYGSANFHSNYGLSFNIGGIDPSYTMGDLERLRREILAALRREGVIDRNKGIQITQPPLKIAVISSEKAAGYGDFIHQLEQNSDGIAFQTMLFPAIMQGDKTARSVMDALDLVEQSNSIVGWDCVVIIRGGGATTDMNGFDDLQLARRVATFPLPVVVGIGHERDRCVLDEIACVRCKTPTAVAAWLIDTAGMAWQRACDLTTRIASFAAERVKGEQMRLQSLETMLPALAESRINRARIQLQGLTALLPAIAREATSKSRLQLENLIATLRMASKACIQRKDTQLQTLATTLRMSATNVVDKEKTRLENLRMLTDVLNPVTTLRRGYSITRMSGKALSSTDGVGKGDVIETITARGSLFSKVEAVEKTQ